MSAALDYAYEPEETHIGPQPGPQTSMAETSADIAVAGGAAGSGKTWSLVYEPLRHSENPKFRAVIFRRESPEITAPGALWDEAMDIYPVLGATANRTALEWTFPSGARVKFAHMQHEDDRFNWRGSQLAMIGFDQLETFTFRQFNYLLSRLRSMSGVRPYVRATANPDPDHFLRKWMEWWIDDETGLAIPERSGVVRWYVLRDDKPVWADSKEELESRFGEKSRPKSFTFVPGTVYDNKILLDQNPDYLAYLQGLQRVDRERLLGGNWNIRETAGNIFKREWFEVVDAAPRFIDDVRGWDRAATPADHPNAESASWTAGVRIGKGANGIFYITDARHFRESAHKVEEAIRNMASSDGRRARIALFQDPGAAGKNEAEDMIRKLAGYNVRCLPTARPKSRRSEGSRRRRDEDPEDSSNAKINYAKPWSRQAEAGNVKLVRGPWNDDFLDECQNFDGVNGLSDQVDAASAAFFLLTNRKRAGTWGRR